jgi:hypothetical protein
MNVFVEKLIHIYISLIMNLQKLRSFYKMLTHAHVYEARPSHIHLTCTHSHTPVAQ